jgi:hypothetical protein
MPFCCFAVGVVIATIFTGMFLGISKLSGALHLQHWGALPAMLQGLEILDHLGRTATHKKAPCSHLQSSDLGVAT